MNEKDKVKLRHMLDAARDAIGFATQRKRSDLDSDRMFYLSLVKCIEIIGEAANQVTEETRRTIPSIAWRNIINMRNWLTHAYFDINPDIIWQTVKEDIPSLVSMLEREM